METVDELGFVAAAQLVFPRSAAARTKCAARRWRREAERSSPKAKPEGESRRVPLGDEANRSDFIRC